MRMLVCFACALVLVTALTGCVRRYNITTASGQQITTKGKPKYDEANGFFRYTDARGAERTIPAGSVREISPASDAQSQTGFNPQPMR